MLDLLELFSPLLEMLFEPLFYSKAGLTTMGVLSAVVIMVWWFLR